LCRSGSRERFTSCNRAHYQRSQPRSRQLRRSAIYDVTPARGRHAQQRHAQRPLFARRPVDEGRFGRAAPQRGFTRTRKKGARGAPFLQKPDTPISLSRPERRGGCCELSGCRYPSMCSRTSRSYRSLCSTPSCHRRCCLMRPHSLLAYPCCCSYYRRPYCAHQGSMRLAGRPQFPVPHDPPCPCPPASLKLRMHPPLLPTCILRSMLPRASSFRPPE
jgi:hypothetical protein